ncbi:NACHT domain-containing protein [Methanobacterium congolense]|uniref:Putative NTPase (NACHT family) n=1 Tax=Methanobacterium congolense TaxID=118062 RepID=A0A1D3L1W0_9EURY|nr:NACHT domain-containing protein [Methanobacterium congolense]SCG85664.1 putative NTPase (NACHT family) [Methanobacterium congolense]
MEWNLDPIPSELRIPSTSEINPPVKTSIQELPFDQLEWKDFEKLCLRLVELDEDVEYCHFYGTPGQSQEGIDIYARPKFKEKYSVYQCKRVRDFSPSKIESAVSKFIGGKWIDKSDTFVLCSSESFDIGERANKIEEQSKRLKKKRVKLIPWDKYKLSKKLKNNPKIVDDFFGRGWVEAFCGHDAANTLGNRLDVNEVIKLRKMLLNLYREIFNEQDRGFSNFLNSEFPSFEDRFVFPYIDTKSSISVEKSQYNSEIINKEFLSKPDGFKLLKNAQEPKTFSFPEFPSLQYNQRQGFEEWLKNSDNNIILGGPGSGKSTLLKFIASDLLSEKPQLNLISEKWGNFIPIWIPFALWTKQISLGNIENYSLHNLIKKWLKSWDHENVWPLIEKGIDDGRVLLLIDGLDEWASENTAKIAFSRLKLFVKNSNIPVIVTSRPHGFERLKIQEMGWQIGNLSDFSVEQQKKLTKIWFTFLIKNQYIPNNEKANYEEIQKRVDVETEEFINELKRSLELKELTKNPLLLSLLIYHKFKKYHLPQSRFKAYDSIIQHLITEHPQMRNLMADVSNPSQEITDDKIESILEYFAYYMQENYSDGLIRVEDAKNHLKNYIIDNNIDLGIPQYQAGDYSKQFLEVSEDVIGIIVKQSSAEIGFLHRVFQEYLAAKYISKKSLDKQKLIIQNYCANQQWQEVLLSLFHITYDSEVIREFIKDIQLTSNNLNHFEMYIVNLMLFEIAFGNYNCPLDLAEELADYAFEKVELESWMPYREHVLNLILLGLNSRLKDKIQIKLKSWFPCREKWRGDIFASMKNWPKTQQVINCLWKGIHDDELVNQRSAASALVVMGKDDPEIKKHMVFLAKNAIDFKIRAVAIEALLNGWQDCEELENILKVNTPSNSPEILLVTIIGRINKNIHTKEDLKELLYLGSLRSLAWRWRDTISFGLLKGWNGSDKIKKYCIRSIAKESRENTLYNEIALKVLLQGYPQDNEVAKVFADIFKNEEHHMFMIDNRKYYGPLVSNFKGNRQLIEAIDEWALKTEKSEFNIPKISILASIGHSPQIRSILLSSLDKITLTSHWAAQALLENWGMNDVDVAEKLTKITWGSNKDASRLAHLFPEIIKDKVKCRKRLIELLKEPKDVYYGSILLGLKTLNNTRNDLEVVEIIMKSPSILEKRFPDDILYRLISYYPLNKKVKELAKNELLKIEGTFGIVAQEYGNDVEIREKIIEMACPLPIRLREIIAKYLGDLGSYDDEFAISLIKLYDYEEDEIVKTQASISYYKLLKSSKNNIEDDLKYLSESIVCYGMHYEERRRAAFCGLLILNRLDIMFDAKEKINRNCDNSCSISLRGMEPNFPFLRLFLENWEYIKNFFGDEFESRFSQKEDSLLNIWNELSILADKYPLPKAEAIDFLQNTKNKTPQENILHFLNRSKSNSHLILDYCIKSLSNDNKFGSWRLAYTAAAILGENFGGDEEVLDYIRTSYTSKKISEENFILALCEGWPKSVYLDDIFKKIREEHRILPLAIRYQLMCEKSQTNIVFNSLKADLAYYISFNPMISKLMTNALIRRIQTDDKLNIKLMEYLQNNPDPSSKISIPKMIVMANGMSSKLKNWCFKELDSQLNLIKAPEVGLDVTTGQLIPVVHALLELL